MKKLAEKVVHNHILYIIIKINYHWTIQYCIWVHLQKQHIWQQYKKKKTQKKKKNLFKHVYEYI